MAAFASIIWLAFIALSIHAIDLRTHTYRQREATLLIIVGGTVVPTATLAMLLAYGLALLPDLLRAAPEGSLRIAVTGEQWWWRVRYPAPGGGTVELANEIRLPVGEPVEFRLDSADVVHSFWIPALGGKVDMIPGRRTRLALTPTREGVFRGVCAEYCGTAHALMAFSVVVLEKERFARWLAQQAEPASEPMESLAVRGRELFFANGCGACHTIRGTSAGGVVGPDLTHVGSRVTLGAGILPNERGEFLRWMAPNHRRLRPLRPPFLRDRRPRMH